MPTDYEDKPSPVKTHDLLVGPVEDVVKVGESLIAEVHREGNNSGKLDKIADVVDVVLSLSEKIYKENNEMQNKLMDKLDQTRDYFAASFEAVTQRLDLMSKQLETKATKDEVSNIRNEMQIAQAEINKKLTALLRK
ncbi:MAG: hypothetical protein KME67_11090 [Candidatus Thiodiazotropha sp. (ex Codakia orbicularis)]|nr:hypothetical protein [Candidatus Thiodiazotropha sp. (ex Codakia orbicularis)]